MFCCFNGAMNHVKPQIFVPITDEMLERDPSLLDQLRPFHIALPCYRSMASQATATPQQANLARRPTEPLDEPKRRSGNAAQGRELRLASVGYQCGRTELG